MKHTWLLLLVFSTVSAAGAISQQITQQLKETPEMSVRCATQINHYADKVNAYQTKINLSTGQKLKLQYYIGELESWQEYCNDDFDQDSIK